MAKIKLTKNELKKQKDALKRFRRYLPTLQLKKQQLQMEIRRIEAEESTLHREKDSIDAEIRNWVAVFGEGPEAGLADLVKIKDVVTGQGNIAGVDIPLLEKVEFEDIAYDFFLKPLWIDSGVDLLKRILELDARINVLQEQIRRLGYELRVTTQRVNLFEKVMIPDAKENIRKIQIYLGDQQTASVVRGKIAKNKADAKEASA